jgi:hypothetical protein
MTTATAVDLTTRAMLVRLTISQWTARKLDKKLTREVTQNHGAADDAARVNKSLISKERLDTISKIATEARSAHYRNTLPWNDDGSRILPAARFMAYRDELNEIRERFETAVEDFCRNYPDYVDAERTRLNGMFRIEDYPTHYEIRDAYSFATHIDPLPSADDFRVQLGRDETERIRQQIEERTAETTNAAMIDLWNRLYEVVKAAADKLSVPIGEDGSIFRDSLIGNVRDLVAILPDLNITNDPNLKTLTEEVSCCLAYNDPESLRKSQLDRTLAAADARRILDSMSQYFQPAA